MDKTGRGGIETHEWPRKSCEESWRARTDNAGREDVHDVLFGKAAEDLKFGEGRRYTARFGQFFQRMLENDVHLARSQREAGFISTAHTGEAIDATITAAEAAFKLL